jgi:beta-glucosidase
MELKGFARVEVPARESRRVTLQLPVGSFGFFDRHLDYVVEPGEFEILVGTSSTDATTVGSVTVVPDPTGAPVRKAFEESAQIG